jgi:histidinol-phosphatase
MNRDDVDDRAPAPEEIAAHLDVGLEIANRCDALTLPAFHERSFSVEWKSNHTEVTEIDRACETLISDTLAELRPDHAMFGEEFGHRRAGRSDDADWQWIVDPIDGTSGFARGIPVWATLLALDHREAGLVAAVVSAPALGSRWWATLGGGTFVNGTRCQVSRIDRIDEAQASITHHRGWDDLNKTAVLVALGQRARRVRGFGDFWQHCLVAEGAIDIAIDAVGLAPYDLAAVRLVVEQAGGTFTDRHGVATHGNETAISTNTVLHPMVLEALAD